MRLFLSRILRSRFVKAAKERESADEKRQVKFVRERDNVWRVVYAD